MINKFVERLKAIGIEVTLTGNYPWIYLNTVNGNRVKETFRANHGFTAFTLVGTGKGTYSITDRREIFKIIRKYR
ncbi:MAG: hypothetical protein DRP57_10370 [Spirochaetes bacterium]|nr:MAG: hypothetical protein DRP57_10370 [Spirochaetota bacterium]